MTDLSAIDRDWRLIGDTTLGVFRDELARVDSPMLDEATTMYDIASPHSALLLAQMWVENQYATTGIIIQPHHCNPLGLRPDDTSRTLGPYAYGTIDAPDGSRYLTFPYFSACVMEWRRRLITEATRYKGGVYARTTDLASLLSVYAPSGDTHPITGVDNADAHYLESVIVKLRQFADAEKETPVADRPYILLTAGHRSTNDGGNAIERDRTDDMARAYLNAFRKAGFPTGYFQSELDADSMPDMTIGDLSTVATGARNVLLKRAEPLAIMLDLHFNMAESPLMMIVPDVDSLRSGYADGAPSDDTAANNTLDVKIAAAIASKMSAALNGKTMFNGILGVKGVMSERETYVAESNWRLGMFGATAVVRARAVRIVIEHGGYNDFTRYPNFPAVCAGAALAAITETLDVATIPTPNPPPIVVPGPAPITYPSGMDEGVAKVLFGEATANTGAVYKFDPMGDISRAWLTRGKDVGAYPRLLSVQVYDAGKPNQRQYFQFSDGVVLWRPSMTDIFRPMKG